MKKFYVTFGQVHRHEIGNTIIDHNIIVEIDSPNYDNARRITKDLFGFQFFTVYIDKPSTELYPRGIVNLKDL